MGTKVQFKSYWPGYYPMRDLNENSNSCSWPAYYGDKPLANGQYYNGFLPRAATDLYSAYDKDVLKRTMLEHEETFKNQVYELHRLYRIQRDLMDEFRRKEIHKNRIPVETSLSSSPLASQITSEDARRWHIPSFPLVNSACARPSVTGAEDIHSPMSSMKGHSAQGGHFASQNGGISKDLEVQDSRPTKVRRKMFDLQLPADEYIDTEEGEQFSEEKVSVMSSCVSNRNHKVAPENGVKLFHGNGGKTGFQGDSLTSDSCLKSRNGLADLNEPIQLEETNASGYVDLMGRGACHHKIQGINLSCKPNSQFVSFPKGISFNSHHGSDNGTRDNRHLENNGNGKGWFSHVLDAGNDKGNMKSSSQSLQPEISSQPLQVLLNKAHEPSAYYLTDQSKAGLWSERTVCGLDMSDRSHEISSNKHLGSIVASHIPSPYPTAPSSDLAMPWSHSVSSWEKPSSSLSQKSMSVQKQPGLNPSATLSKSSQSSVQSNGFFGDSWHHKSNSHCNPGFGSEVPYKNGFYQGSSSGSKELPVHLSSISYLSCSNDHNRAPDHFVNNGLVKYYKGSDCIDMKSVKDENYVVLSNSSTNKVAPQQGFEIIDGGQKHEDHLAVLPWLRPNPTPKNEASNVGRISNTEDLSFLQSSPNQLSNKNEIGQGTNKFFTQNVKSVSCSNDIEVKRIEISDYPSNKKILGFPIFEKSHISKNESSSFTSPSVSLPLVSEGEVVEINRKSRILDINLPCEPAVPDTGNQIATEILVKDKKRDAIVSSLRHNIDLNFCISDDEASLVPSIPSTNVKISAGIDLEAPVVVDTEEDVIPIEAAEKQHDAPLQSPKHKAEHLLDELMVVAAEAMVAISSNLPNQCENATCNPAEASMMDCLNWFVEIVASCGDDIENKFDTILRVKDGEDNEESSSEGSDYFESMTLKLMETKEEDYMPKPLVPENLKLEETGTTLLPNRPRKGQARRGRQRRDFQRDILPGLASLSRHEVTEDLQTFGGLMRATGHMWHSGLTRRSSTRNGCGRGRRRSVANTSPTVPTSPRLALR